MKIKLLIVFFLFLCKGTISNAHAQDDIDTALAQKITVAGFCLCKTNLKDLQNLTNDLRSVEVEEMDLGKKCISQDSRYENGKGYVSIKYPGLIFQKDQEENYISKIRLTKDFIGHLPDGSPVNMKTLLLKDVLKLYPKLDSTWGSRGCSDYWNFSNDTISFFVRVDRNKNPQFPIDKTYYLEKPIEGIDIMMSCYNVFTKSDDFSLFGADEPMYFLDSTRINQGVLQITSLMK